MSRLHGALGALASLYRRPGLNVWLTHDLERALLLAYHDAGLCVWTTGEEHAVRVAGGFLEIGPFAPPDTIATESCRYILARKGVRDTRLVAELVANYGFQYAPS